MSDELTSDFTLIQDSEATTHPGWQAFVRQMKGRDYGRGPLNAAWLWFRAGWEEKECP